MAKHTFTPEEIEIIQINVIGLLFYVKIHDKRDLPHCFRNCERIVKNIDICRSDCYADIEELTTLIKEDWHTSFGARTGLLDYCIPNAEMEIQKNMNCAISRQISVIERYIGHSDKFSFTL